VQLNIKIIFYIIFSLGLAQFQDSTQIQLPLSKQLLWGQNGLIRKMNLAPESRKAELKLRHKMLKTHQTMGLVTLTMMGYQFYLGEQLYNGKEVDATTHKFLGYSTFTTYLTTASLSIGAPPAMRYSKGVSSIKLHRYLSYIHFAGMLTIPYLGYLSAGNLDYVKNDVEYNYSEKAIKAHRLIGNITIASFSLAFFTTFLP
jgi:hypothetical protein